MDTQPARTLTFQEAYNSFKSDTEKMCTGPCGQIKPLNQFYKKRATKNQYMGYSAWCKACTSTRYTKEERREQNLRKNYKGFTQADYDNMFTAQNGVCASCGQPETRTRVGRNATDNMIVPLAVDHDHVTDEVRGLLCHACNQALGQLGDDPTRIEALLKYALERCNR